MLVGGSLVCAAGFAVLTQGTRRRAARGGRPQPARHLWSRPHRHSGQRGHGGHGGIRLAVITRRKTGFKKSDTAATVEIDPRTRGERGPRWRGECVAR
jgi:hypothetical protein